MSTCYLPLIGRFGNLLFQYCYLRSYCEGNGLELCLHPWVGEQVFEIPAAVRPRKGREADVLLPEDTHQRQESLLYTKQQVRDWLRIKPSVLERLQPARQGNRILLDWRRGSDYLGAGLVSLGSQCYLDAMVQHGYLNQEHEWEIDTDPTRLPAFQGDPTASGFNTTWVSLPAFYRMMTAPVHFRANSTFSWWAATLGDAKVFAPVIKGVRGGVPDAYAQFVAGNWPVCADNYPNTDLHLHE